MHAHIGMAWLVALAFIASAASSFGQAVQLPSLSVFGVDTTVVVPDRAGAYLAGDRRASNSLSTFGGLPPNRGLGSSRLAAGAQVNGQMVHQDEPRKQLPKPEGS